MLSRFHAKCVVFHCDLKLSTRGLSSSNHAARGQGWREKVSRMMIFSLRYPTGFGSTSPVRQAAAAGMLVTARQITMKNDSRGSIYVRCRLW